MSATHYSLAHKPKKLNEWADSVVGWIDMTLGNDSTFIPMFCYRGMSGVAHATAVLLAWERRFPEKRIAAYYVRKNYEDSHGRNDGEFLFPDNIYGAPFKLIFIDDLVSAGITRQATLNATLRLLRERNYDYDQVTYLQAVTIGCSVCDFSDIGGFEYGR